MFCKTAVILAAGLGSRLGKMTEDKPKCLVTVNGIPILIRMLDHLNTCGFDKVVIVIGYMGQRIIDTIGCQYGGISITYIWNKIFYRTNTMFSVWLARKYIARGALLIEGDIVFDDNFIKLFRNRTMGIAIG